MGISELQITGAHSQQMFYYQQYCGHFNQGRYNIFLVLTQKNTQPIHNFRKTILSKMSLYGSIVLPKNGFKNVLPTIRSNFHFQNGRHKNSAESENAPYLSNQSS